VPVTQPQDTTASGAGQFFEAPCRPVQGQPQIDVETTLRIAPTVDDLWFHWHLAARGVPIHLISTDYATGSLAGAETDAADSLHLRYNLQGGNDAAIAALKAHFRARTGAGLADRAG
jgi:hypothetical protein